MKKIILSLMGISLFIVNDVVAATARTPVAATTRAPVTVTTTSAAVPTGAVSRAAVKRTSVMNSGTTVAARTAPTGLYSQECYDAYYGCLDQFCMSDNASGGRCACSDDNAGYEEQIAAIKAQDINAENLRTVEVEKIQAGARADIIFSGEREYDDAGNVITQQKRDSTTAKRSSRVDLNLWNNDLDFGLDNIFENTVESLADKTGGALYNGARNLCMERIPAACKSEISVLTQLYQTQIKSDCNAFATAVATQKRESDLNLAAAQAEVREARLASFESANKYNRGECLIEFKGCMVRPEVCGADWSRCASAVASENMQNNRATSTANTRVATIEKFKISKSTEEMLESKRNMCEGILDQCMAVRDSVWPDFLRDIAPELKVAELNLESNMRQSCMTDISNCITGRACADTIAGGNTIDACLSQNGQVARAVCKNVIDPCERMEPLIWDYTVARLRAMGADRCTEEVKTCFTRTCGENFANCIGMDYDFMHEMCPLDSLVVCKNMYAQNGKDFSMDDLDGLLMGLYLNADNAALDNCQNLVETKMLEVCGSTTDCNKFTADENIGAGSLSYQKSGNIYSVAGMISFGLIKVGNGYDVDGKADPDNAGKIDITDYVAGLSNAGVPAEYVSVADRVVYELQNIQGTVNRVVDLIAQDPKIQYCVTGRNLEQITGTAGMTTARFPNLLNQVKMQIAVSALRQAQDNYSKKYNEYVARASSESSTDMANLMCNKLPAANGQASGLGAADLDASGLNKPYALVLEIAGVSDVAIAAGGTHSSQTLGGAKVETASGMAAGAGNGGVASTIGATVAGAGVKVGTSAFAAAGGAISAFSGVAVSMNPAALIADSAVKAIGVLGSSRHKVEFDGGTREMWSVFNRQDRICHYCTEIVTKNCKTTGSRGFLGLWDSRGVKCESSEPVQECKDIPM